MKPLRVYEQLRLTMRVFTLNCRGLRSWHSPAHVYMGIASDLLKVAGDLRLALIRALQLRPQASRVSPFKCQGFRQDCLPASAQMAPMRCAYRNITFSTSLSRILDDGLKMPDESVRDRFSNKKVSYMPSSASHAKDLDLENLKFTSGFDQVDARRKKHHQLFHL